MGGGSGASKGTSETTNKIPAELSGLTTQTAGKIGQVQGQPGFDVSQYGAARPQNVPGLAGGQQEAINQAYGIGATPWQSNAAAQTVGAAGGYAGQSGRATGGTLATDPGIAAAYQSYLSNVQPGLQNQFGLMGLGKSSLLGDALARGAASQLEPATQAALQREQSANEARIGRETSTALQAANQYAGLGQQDVNQRLQSLNALMQTGQLERGVEGERSTAEQQDFLRRQALAEQGTFGVLGQLPSTLGQSVASKSSGGGK